MAMSNQNEIAEIRKNVLFLCQEGYGQAGLMERESHSLIGRAHALKQRAILIRNSVDNLFNQLQAADLSSADSGKMLDHLKKIIADHNAPSEIRQEE